MLTPEEIKSKINLRQYLEGRGFQFNGNRSTCPFHKSSNNTTFSFKDDQVGYCFAENKSFDVLEAAKYFNNNDFKEGVKELHKLIGVEYNEKRNKNESISRSYKTYESFTKNCAENLYKNNKILDSILKRGISRNTIEKLDIGYSNINHEISDELGLSFKGKPSFTNRIIFPYFKYGKPVYFCGRDTTGTAKSKYKKMRSTPYNDHCIWGWDTMMRGGDTLYIAEGAFDAFSLVELELNVISPITGKFSHNQLKELKENLHRWKEIVITTDYDPVSKAGQHNLMEMGLELRKNRTTEIYVVEIEGGSQKIDISEILEKQGKLGLKNLLLNKKSFDEYYLSKIDKNNIKIDLVKKMKQIIPYVNEIQLVYIINYITEKFSMNKGTVKELIKAIKDPNEMTIAKEIIDNNIIIYNSALGFLEYKHGYYQEIDYEIINKKIQDFLGFYSTAQKVQNVRKLIQSEIYKHIDEIEPFELREKYLNVKNGLFNLETFKLEEYTSEYIFLHQIPVNYNEKADYKKWDDTLRIIFEDNLKKKDLIQEFMGYSLWPVNPYEKGLWMFGDGSNGKSTILDGWEYILGQKNIAAIKMANLNEKHTIANLKNVMVNVVSEDKASTLQDPEIFKSLVSNEMIYAEHKYQKGFNFRPYCKFVVSFNNLPHTKDLSYGFFRKVLIINFNLIFVINQDEYIKAKAKYPEANIKWADINIKRQLKKEKDGILLWAIQGLKRLKDTNGFTKTYEEEDTEKMLKLESDSVYNWIYNKKEDIIDLIENGECTKEDFFENYSEYCKHSNMNPVKANTFWRRNQVGAYFSFDFFRPHGGKAFIEDFKFTTNLDELDYNKKRIDLKEKIKKEGDKYSENSQVKVIDYDKKVIKEEKIIGERSQVNGERSQGTCAKEHVIIFDEDEEIKDDLEQGKSKNNLVQKRGDPPKKENDGYKESEPSKVTLFKDITLFNNDSKLPF